MFDYREMCRAPKVGHNVYLALAGQPQTMLDMGARTANQFNRRATAQKWQSGISKTRIIFLGNKLRQSESLNGPT